MAGDCDIAIVGASGRFPGADNLNEFWRVLLNGENHVTEIPRERWNNDAFYSEDKDANGKIYVKRAGLIKGHDEFDPRPFGISDMEAERMDPQQRYVLECVGMALEDGGITRDRISGSRTGVYIGCMNDDYKSLFTGHHEYDNSYSATGFSPTIISARVSYVFNLHGPCLTIDTACSSALVAIHLGASAVLTGDCEMAVCGGVSSIITPETFIPLCKARMMSAAGQCQTFCNSADGYARGEGCGIVILKKLSQAIKDANKIWAVIKTGTNQDGRAAQPITAPSEEQQYKLLDILYSSSCIDPSRMQYIEAHGTGTPVGDPSETNTLGRFFSQYRKKKSLPLETLFVGSVKTNIGHTESAAGVAGILKVLLMMKHGKIVPSLHLQKDKSNLNPAIRLNDFNMDIPVNVENWEPNEHGDRLGCVNSFGFGGSNGHAILIQKQSFTRTYMRDSGQRLEIDRFVVISSVTFDGLKLAQEKFKEDIEQSSETLESISFTSTCRRDHFQYRLGFAASTLNGLVSQAQKTAKDNKPSMPTNIVFVFCGVGTTWSGMCSELIRVNEAFRKGVEDVDRYLIPLAGMSMAEIFAGTETDYTNPFLNHVSIFTMQIGLVEMWRDIGVLPNVIVGQSVGEVAAAYISGSLDLKSAVDVIYHRSKILANVTGGAMLVVKNISIEVLEAFCNNYNRRVTIAVYSSPVACTLSGESDVMTNIKEDILEYAAKNNIDVLVRDLEVQCAYHSHMVEACMSEIKHTLKNLKIMPRTVSTVSTVTGKLATSDEFQTGIYWAKNIREPVLLSDAIANAIKSNYKNLFLEIGPKQILRAHIKDIIKDDAAICLPSMSYKRELSSRSSTIIEMFENGVNIKWENVVKICSLSAIPSYAFIRRKILFIPDEVRKSLHGYTATSFDDHMFLRNSEKERKEFKIVIGKNTTPYVFDHFMAGALLLPGATYVEAAMVVASKKFNKTVVNIALSLEFINTFTPSEVKETDIECEVKLCEKELEIEFSNGNRLLSVGKARTTEGLRRKNIKIKELKGSLMKQLTKAEVYTALERLGFTYGSTLSLIEQAWFSDTVCLVELHVPSSVMQDLNKTCVHPAVVDSVFQIFAIFTSRSLPAFPKGLKTFRIKGHLQQRMFCYAVKLRDVGQQTYYNAILLDEDGGVICEFNEFYTQELSEIKTNSNCYKLDWHALTNDDETTTLSVPNSRLLIFGTDAAMELIATVSAGMTIHSVLINFEEKSTWMIPDNGLEQINKRTYTAIVFAPFTHITLTKEFSEMVYDISKRTILCLKDLLKYLSKTSMHIPLFIMTNNTQRQSEQGENVLNGSELWGMVRCAAHESIYRDIRLLDIDCNNCDKEAFQKVINNRFPAETEIRIEGKSLWKTRLTNTILSQKESKKTVYCLENGTMAFLKSAQPKVVYKPYLELAEQNQRNDSDLSDRVRLRVKYLCLHQNMIFPVTSNEEDENHYYSIWPQISEYGFKVTCLEGEGCFETVESVTNCCIRYFCCPVIAATYIDIPSENVFEPNELPYYAPGLLSSSVILSSLALRAPKKSHIVILLDESIQYCQSIMEIMLKIAGECSVSHINRADILQQTIVDEDKISKRIQCVISLTRLSKQMFKYLIKCMPDMKNLITLSIFMVNGMDSWLTFSYPLLTLTKLEPYEIFHTQQLKLTLPIVRLSLTKWHRHIPDNKECQYAENLDFKNPLSLPCRIISMINNKRELPVHIPAKFMFLKNNCYIVVGGLTGLGWKLVEYIAEMGGGYIRSISRRKPSASQQKEINRLKNKSQCCIKAIQCDITELSNLDNTVKTIQCELKGVPIKGIFNGAGVLADCLLVNMTDELLDKVLKPKILGSLNLHLTTQHLNLDFFVMHSSIASIIGNTGQCSYGGANSFIDALAHYRRRKQLSGQSINWGPLSVGMAQEKPEVKQRLQQIGMSVLETNAIYTLLLDSLLSDNCQIILGSFNWAQIGKNLSSTKLEQLLPLYKEIGHEIRDKQYNRFDKETFHQLQENNKNEILFDILVQVLSNVFSITDICILTPEFNIVDLGVDSFSAMSFVNKVLDLTGCRLPIQLILSDETTLQSIIVFLRENLHQSGKHNADVSQISPDLHPEAKLSFCEKAVLLDYDTNKNKGNFLRVFDLIIEITELNLSTWEKLLRHVVYMNQELCRKFIVIGNEVEVIHVAEENIDLKVEVVPVDEIGSSDPRKYHIIDLREELPIKFQIAFGGEFTMLRMMLHAVAQDLPTLTFIYKDLQNVANALLLGQSLPTKHNKPNISRILHAAVNKRHKDMKQYWSKQMKEIQQVVSLSTSNSTESLDADQFKVTKYLMPESLINKIIDFIKKHKFTIFQFFVSIYQLLLYFETRCEKLPIVSATDMRIHDEKLTTAFGRCVNYVPYIATFREHNSFRNFFDLNSKHVQSTVENSAYPYHLILEETSTPEIRKHIGRHKLVMDNFVELGPIMQNEDSRIKMKNMWVTSNEEETCLYVGYDMQAKKINITFGYNTGVCGETRGDLMLTQIMSLTKRCLEEYDKPLTRNTIGRPGLQPFVKTDKLKHTSGYGPKSCMKEDRTNSMRRSTLDTKDDTDHFIEGIQFFNSETVEKISDIIKTGIVRKQTRQGWDHRVQLTLKRIAPDRRSIQSHTYSFEWANMKSRKIRSIPFSCIKEVHCWKQISDFSAFVIHTEKRKYVMVTDSPEEAEEWMTSIQSAIDTTNTTRL